MPRGARFRQGRVIVKVEKKTIAKFAVSAAAVFAAVGCTCGIFTGEHVTYDTVSSKRAALDAAIQDGVYVAESANNFSNVRVDMTIQDHAIADCAISSSGDADLLTDALREEWAEAIVTTQSSAPDAVTGATLVYSAGSVTEAVENIFSQAKGEIPLYTPA